MLWFCQCTEPRTYPEVWQLSAATEAFALSELKHSGNSTRTLSVGACGYLKLSGNQAPRWGLEREWISCLLVVHRQHTLYRSVLSQYKVCCNLNPIPQCSVLLLWGLAGRFPKAASCALWDFILPSYEAFRIACSYTQDVSWVPQVFKWQQNPSWDW